MIRAAGVGAATLAWADKGLSETVAADGNEVDAWKAIQSSPGTADSIKNPLTTDKPARGNSAVGGLLFVPMTSLSDD